MKLKSTFVVNIIGGETVGVPLTGGFHGVVTANESAAFILECLKSETTRDGILDRLLEEYDVSREIAERDLDKVLEQLIKIDAVE